MMIKNTLAAAIATFLLCAASSSADAKVSYELVLTGDFWNSIRRTLLDGTASVHIEVDNFITVSTGQLPIGNCTLMGATAVNTICAPFIEFDPNGFSTGHVFIPFSFLDIGTGIDAGPQYAWFAPGSLSSVGVHPLVTTDVSDGNGHSYGTIFSSGSLTVSTVPEPATYAFMLAGLGLFGAVRQARARA